ncbi:RagB/SusD family nutrient uptake outer membrane protein [Phocaeicola plebeius]|uniref:RagB/SusD family nutrient uptake outer membrane protein n=1 Tax=Phocaeicola plebeius TaxID=310297 RepID=UPI0026F07AEB|nr:RagB/SusD family nutrient uptake outer membrane protein [Phocaeicola plebeius]
MKRIKKYMRICLGTALISLTACQPDMDFTNPSADSEANYYNTKEHLTYAVNGAYNMLQRGGGWARWMPFMLNARSDEYVFTSGAQAGEPETARLAMYTANADLGSLSATYQDLYTMQYAANLALEKLEINQDGAFDLNNTEDKALYDRLRGEAIFLRGLSRFYLVYFWGDEIPDRSYVTKTDGSDYLLPPAAPGEIYKNMVQDFKDAAALLPWHHTNPDDNGRATKGSALAFLAKTYMGRPILDGTAKAGDADWAAAKDVLGQIIGKYDLMPNYRDNFTDQNENNIESLFEVQFCESRETAGFNPAAPGDINSWVTTGQNTMRIIEITAPNSAVSTRWWNGMPSLAIYNEFERDDYGNIIDPRAFYGMYIPNGCDFGGKDLNSDNVNAPVIWIGYDKLFYNWDNDKQVDTFAEWRGKWFGCRKYSKDQYEADLRSGINDRLIRYSDILLMYAECCLEADNDEAKAKEYIQMVRDRANNNTEAFNTTQADAGKSYLKGGTLPTVDELLQKKPVVGRVVGSNGDVICEGMELNSVRRILKHEYSVELYWEGWRFFNLMRWYNNPNDPDQSIVLNNLKNKNALQVEQTNLTGTQVFDYSRHLRVPIPSTELSTNTNMHGNSAN